MGFISVNFYLPMPYGSRLRIRSGTNRRTDRQTDRQTDNGHQYIMPPPYGAGHNK